MALLIFRTSLAITLFLSVVVPNSLQLVTAVALGVCALSGIFVAEKSQRLMKILALYGLTLFVTFFYILVGVTRGAPLVATLQVITIYAVSPLLWIFVAAGMHKKIQPFEIPRWTAIFIILASASVALFFYLFLIYGSDSVKFFIETANVNLEDGYVGATMSVYGSFIFLAGALIASPTVISNLPLRIFCLACILTVVFTSGRSVLILTLIVSSIIFIFFRRMGFQGRRSLGSELGFGAALLGCGLVYLYVASVDLGLILQLFTEELASGGGKERVEQSVALLNGVADTWGLGAGHGIGVDYVRSQDYPWRYELVWMATLYRVGLVGFIIYFMPAFFYFVKFFKLYLRRQLSKLDVFMFGGFFCAFMASNTNPYAEAFSFQWMYVIPVIFLMLKKETR